jgi:methylated-DNA-protein-cysteine methyltransferase-like protein
MSLAAAKGLHRRILDIVARIPRGRIATYGQVARLAGLPGHARLVGYALHALPARTSIPWQRVVNAQGAISTPPGHDARQRRLLEREGVRFDASGRIPLASFRWRPKRPPARDRPATGPA